MKEATLVLIAVVFAVTPGGMAARNAPAEPTTIVQGYGLSILVPEGWEGRVSQASPDDAITLEASSVALPPLGEVMTGDLLGPDDAYIVIDDIGTRGALGRELRLPITIGPQDIAGPYEGGFPAGAGFGAVVGKRDLMFRLRFGSPPDPSDLEMVNRILATFSAAPPG